MWFGINKCEEKLKNVASLCQLDDFIFVAHLWTRKGTGVCFQKAFVQVEYAPV